MATTPRDNGQTLDGFNDQLRTSPVWQDFMRRNGVNPAGPVRLSDSQRKALQQALEASGVSFASGMQIDPAGNVNQDQGVSAAWNNPWIRYPVLGGAAMTGLGAAGIGPMSGIFGGGGGAAATGAGAAGAAGGSAPLGGMMPAAAGAGAGAAAKGFLGGLQDFVTDPSNLIGLGSVVAGLVGGRGNSNTQDTEEMKRIQQITEARMRRTDPLHQVATNLAFGRMPTNYKQGVSLPNVPLPPER